ncbi:MAG: L,D-transpeptidase family protein [Pseudomonadota bacterium]
MRVSTKAGLMAAICAFVLPLSGVQPKATENRPAGWVEIASARNQASGSASDQEKWWLRPADAGPIQVIVSINDQTATVYQGGNRVARSRVSTGKRGHTTPTGLFSILQKNRHHRSNIYSNAPMPFMQRLTWSGIALHASNSVPNYPASHGCVRLPNAFAKKLFRFTELGAHVVISDEEVRPKPFEHPALFQPVPEPIAPAVAETIPTQEIKAVFVRAEDPSLDGPVARYPRAVGGRPAVQPLASISVASLRLSRTDAEPVTPTAAAPKSDEPIRILITRRTGREMIRDVQTMLNDLGYEAGEVDGWMGQNTGGAIRRFQEENELQPTGAMSADLVKALYEASGRGEPLMGHIYVRQKFKPLLDAPIALRDPEKALGAHFFTAIDVDSEENTASWSAVSVSDRPQKSRFSFIEQPEVDTKAMTAEEALSRVDIPADIRTRISAMLIPGSSLAISDNGLSQETGRGTDFVVLTR